MADFIPENRERLRPNLVMREFWPSASAIRVDGANRIWVFSYRREDGQPYDYRVMDRSGKLLGKGKVTEIPSVITKDHMYYMEEVEDEEDEGVFLVKRSIILTLKDPS